MKRSLLAGSLVVMTLVQSVAYADLMDLPDPGGDNGGHTTPVTPTPDNTQTQTQYAGSLRLSGLSRKTGGTLYKVDLAEAARIQRLDIRIAANRLKIYQTTLVTKSGNKIQVQQLSDVGVVETNATVNSENISLNENISSIEILAESYGGEAEAILTVVASSAVPKMVLRQDAKPQTPVVVTPKPETSPTPYEPSQPTNPGDGGSIVYYGTKFKNGERVLYRQRSLGTVSYVYNRTVVVYLDDGYEVDADPSELNRSIRCSGGLCALDRVVYSGEAGQILAIYDNQLADVQMDGGGYGYQGGQARRFLVNIRVLKKQTEPMARAVECTNDRRFCLGDRVQYDGYVVTITKIYSDGTAVVTDAAGSQKVKIRSLVEIPRRRW